MLECFTFLSQLDTLDLFLQVEYHKFSLILRSHFLNKLRTHQLKYRVPLSKDQCCLYYSISQLKHNILLQLKILFKKIYFHIVFLSEKLYQDSWTSDLHKAEHNHSMCLYLNNQHNIYQKLDIRQVKFFHHSTLMLLNSILVICHNTPNFRHLCPINLWIVSSLRMKNCFQLCNSCNFQ